MTETSRGNKSGGQQQLVQGLEERDIKIRIKIRAVIADGDAADLDIVQHDRIGFLDIAALESIVLGLHGFGDIRQNHRAHAVVMHPRVPEYGAVPVFQAQQQSFAQRVDADAFEAADIPLVSPIGVAARQQTDDAADLLIQLVDGIGLELIDQQIVHQETDEDNQDDRCQ